MMKYRYITIYHIRGLNHDPIEGDIRIFEEQGKVIAVKALLTKDHDYYCYEIDRAQAVGYLMLKGFVGQGEATDLKPVVESEIARIRERRAKEIGTAETFVFIAESQTEPDFSSPTRETDDYIMGFDIINKGQIIAKHEDQVNAILVALCLSTAEHTVQFNRLRGGVYLVSELGKPVYSFSLSGTAEAYVSRQTTNDTTRAAQSHAAIFVANTSLFRVYRLLVQSISIDNDELRRFMFGWSGLEILINKIFSTYEKQFVQNLIGTNPASPAQKYFERIRDVMESKYRLMDKFIVVAACIGDASADADMESFRRIKETRDRLMHGDTLDEKSLPISETVALLKKYLRQHIDAKGRLTIGCSQSPIKPALANPCVVSEE